MTQRLKRLGEMLIDANLITRDQLLIALERQKSWGDRLGANLIATGALSEEELLLFLARNTGIGEIDLDREAIPPSVVQLITDKVAEQFKLIPVRQEEKNTLLVACADPTDLSALDQVAFITGCKIKPLISSYSSIMRAISRCYAVGYNGQAAGIEPEIERHSERKSTEEDTNDTLTDDPEIIIFGGNRRSPGPPVKEIASTVVAIDEPAKENESTDVSLDEELGFDFGRPLLNYAKETEAPSPSPVASMDSSQFSFEHKMIAMYEVMIRKGLISEQEINSELMRLWSLGKLK